jgi:hypothetical protein
MKQTHLTTLIPKLIQIAAASTLAAMLFFATRYGLGLSPDSVAYIKGAEGLLTGKGADYMSVQWPPLYPLMLVLFSYIGNHELLLGARLLNALLIGLNFWLITQLLIQYVNINRWIASLLAFAISLHEVLIYVEFYAWSEPLVITTILINLIIIKSYICSENKNNALLEGGLILFATLSVYTRYIGVNVALINAVVVFLFVSNINVITRLWRAAVQVVIPLALIYPWLAWHSAIDDNNTTQRGLQFHPISLEKILNGFINIGKWLYPSSSKFDGLVPPILLLATGLIVVLLVIYTVIYAGIKLLVALRKKNKISNSKDKKIILLGVIGLFIIFYLAFLIFSISFVDRKLLLDNRFLAPIFIPVILLLLGLMSLITKPVLRYACFGLFLIVMAFSYINLRSWLLISYFDGIEINSRVNINKPIYKKIQTYSTQCQFYSDKPWNISLLFDKKVRWLPTEILFGTGLINQSYRSEIESLKEKTNLVVVENKEDTIVDEIDALPGLERIYDSNDGIMWKNNNIDFTVCRRD